MSAEEQTWADESQDPPRGRSTPWTVLGTSIVVVLGVFLVLIVNSLTRIDSDLRTTDAAVGGLSGRTAAMPAQLERLNRSLALADAALRILPNDTDKIADNLAEIVSALELVHADLAGAAPRLANTAQDLEPAAVAIGRIGTNLGQASVLLERILARTGRIDSTVARIHGKGRTGLAGVRARIATLNDVLRAVRGDLGDIGATGERINGHLENVCRSAAVTVRRGPQPC